MERFVCAVGYLLVTLAAWPLDYNRYEAELVRTYAVGDGLAEFRVAPGHPLTSGPSAVAFDRIGNVYVCDAVRKRLAVGDRGLEIREEHYGTFSGYGRMIEVTERGIGVHDFGSMYSWVDRSFENRFVLLHDSDGYEIETGSDLYYGDAVFAYSRQMGPISFVRPGLDPKENEARMLGSVQTRELFREPDKHGLTGLTLDDMGRLFIDGEIETRSYPRFLEWCEEQGGGEQRRASRAVSFTWEPRQALHSGTYRGRDANGNTYWYVSLAIAVFSRQGQLIDMFAPPQEEGIQTVHPSGDTYGIREDGRVVRLKRIRNVWDPKARELWEAHVISTTGEGIRSAEVTAGPLRVRRAAGPMGEIEGELARGDRVEVLWHGSEKAQIDGKDEYWYEVRRKSDGLQGWVYGGYLRIE